MTNIAPLPISKYANKNSAYYGAVGDGSHDDTSALQSGITENENVCGKFELQPSKTFSITDELVVTKSMTLAGGGVASFWGGMDEAQTRIIGVEIPTKAPYLKGSVIVQNTAGKNAITINALGESVHLRDFGIRFADSICFSDTGHGVRVLPPLNVADQLPDFGLYNSAWDNVFVWGTDGNHYAFSIVNPVLCNLNNLCGFGGGGLEMYANTNMTSPGNSVITHPYFASFVGGASHGIYIHASGNTFGCILSLFIRPQVNFLTAPAAWSVTPIDIDVQKTFYTDDKAHKLMLLHPDFETIIGGGWHIGAGVDFTCIPAGGGGLTETTLPNARINDSGLLLLHDNGTYGSALEHEGVVIKCHDSLNFRRIKIADNGTISSEVV